MEGDICISDKCINHVPWTMVIMVSPMLSKLVLDIIFISDITKQEMMLAINDELFLRSINSITKHRVAAKLMVFLQIEFIHI